MNYVNNAAIGTPDNPTAISFLAADNLYGDGWYTVSGIKLSGKPSLRGVLPRCRQPLRRRLVHSKRYQAQRQTIPPRSIYT